MEAVLIQKRSNDWLLETTRHSDILSESFIMMVTYRKTKSIISLNICIGMGLGQHEFDMESFTIFHNNMSASETRAKP